MHRVSIIGAGIGGLTLYHALKRQGIEADLYEAAPVLSAVGAGIGVPANGMQVFTRLGLAEAILHHGCIPNSAQIRDVQAGVLQSMDLTWSQGQFGPGVAIHRAALQQILAAGIAGEHLHLGKTCTRVRLGDGVTYICFADGSEVPASVVVAADGLRSAVRQCVFPESRLRYAGETSYRGVATVDLPPDLVRTFWEIWGNRCRFGFMGIGGGQVYWFAAVASAPECYGAPEEVMEKLRRLAAAFPAPIPSLVAATASDAIVQTDLYDLVPLKQWHSGRVVLIGDATHATTPNLGQGAAQAIEDAYCLADMLARNAIPEVAFTAFQKARRAKANEIVRQSWWLGKIAQMSHPVARRARNLAFKAIPEFVTRRSMDRLLRLTF